MIPAIGRNRFLLHSSACSPHPGVFSLSLSLTVSLCLSPFSAQGVLANFASWQDSAWVVLRSTLTFFFLVSYSLFLPCNYVFFSCSVPPKVEKFSKWEVSRPTTVPFLLKVILDIKYKRVKSTNLKYIHMSSKPIINLIDLFFLKHIFNTGQFLDSRIKISFATLLWLHIID